MIRTSVALLWIGRMTPVNATRRLPPETPMQWSRHARMLSPGNQRALGAALKRDRSKGAVIAVIVKVFSIGSNMLTNINIGAVWVSFICAI
jgi:hypothetical protein